MNWPPAKAWTSNVCINGQFDFVAINYGGELLSRWVVLMSVLDSNLVVKVPWSQLVDLSNWEAGWDERNYIGFSNLFNNKGDLKNTEVSNPSIDSGLTMPISENTIRPWFNKL